VLFRSGEILDQYLFGGNTGSLRSSFDDNPGNLPFNTITSPTTDSINTIEIA
jgi:hypothetical protein